jgi:antagonist of KipI
VGVEIISSGALSSIQDLGRLGYQEFGIAPSGACDLVSMMLANQLVSNEDEEAVIEMTLYGGAFRFLQPVYVAITGADMSPVKNKKPVPMYETILMQRDDVLEFGFAKGGCRTYLSFSGGILLPPVMGSKSTNLNCKLGGLCGRELRAFDQLNLQPLEQELPIFHMKKVYPNRALPFCKFSHSSPRSIPIRLVLGPQAEYFTEKGIQTLLNSTYKINLDSNRMACKLEGEPVERIRNTDILSDGIALGSVQISSNGLPMIMLQDRQTIGGYAKVATVISSDIPILAQLIPGDLVHFMIVTRTEALKVLKKQLYLRKRKAYLKKKGV